MPGMREVVAIVGFAAFAYFWFSLLRSGHVDQVRPFNLFLLPKTPRYLSVQKLQQRGDSVTVTLAFVSLHEYPCEWVYGPVKYPFP